MAQARDNSQIEGRVYCCRKCAIMVNWWFFLCARVELCGACFGNMLKIDGFYAHRYSFIMPIQTRQKPRRVSLILKIFKLCDLKINKMCRKELQKCVEQKEIIILRICFKLRRITKSESFKCVLFLNEFRFWLVCLWQPSRIETFVVSFNHNQTHSL